MLLRGGGAGELQSEHAVGAAGDSEGAKDARKLLAILAVEDDGVWRLGGRFAEADACDSCVKSGELRLGSEEKAHGGTVEVGSVEEGEHFEGRADFPEGMRESQANNDSGTALWDDPPPCELREDAGDAVGFGFGVHGELNHKIIECALLF